MSYKQHPKRQKDTLRELNVRPTKERGQNFLIRPEITESIAQFGEVEPGRHIVEIGPGTGALTTFLAPLAGTLTLVELEPRFCEHLRQAFPQAQVINRDVRSVDFSEVGSKLCVYGNIPYVFSTDIVFQLIKNRQSIEQVVLMTQREFAERLAADPGGRDYGSISVAVQLFADIDLGPVVPGTAFHPPTEVESQVLRMRFLPQPRVDVGDPQHFEKVVRCAFAQRRKKLINSIISRGIWTKETVLAALNRAGISPDVRPEQLSMEQFAALARELAGQSNS